MNKQKLIPLLCALIVSVIGLLALSGWVFNIEALKSVLPGLVSMKANTSIAFIAGGISLILTVTGRNSRVRRLLSLALAGLVFIIGAATISEYFFNVNLGIDQLLFKDSPGAIATLGPGRMAPTTALCFTMIGFSLLLSAIGRAVLSAQVIALLVGFIGLSNMLGYTYGIKALYGIGRFTQMALHTTAAFVILGIGVLMAKSNKAIAEIIAGKGPGSISARRMIPVAVVLPIVVGYLRILGERTNLYPSEIGVGLVVLIYIAILTVSVLWSSYIVNKVSRKAQLAADEWLRTFNSISDMIFIIDTDNNITAANKAFIDAIKMPIELLRKKKCYEIMHKSDKPWPSCPLEKTKRDLISHTEEVDDPNIGLPLLVTTSPIFDKDGVFIGAVHIAKSIIERKRMEEKIRESEERYRLLFTESKDAMMTCSPDGGFLFGNKEAVRMFGCRDEKDFVSRSPAELSPKYQPDGTLSSDKAREMMLLAIEKGSNFFEWTHKRPDGTEFPVTVLLTKVAEGSSAYLQATVRDISKEKELLGELKNKIGSLERFQKITVDRELKMKELKARIKELETKG